MRIELTVPGELPLDALSAAYDLECGEQSDVEMKFCDTFDWRLYRRGLVFAAEREPGGPFRCALRELAQETNEVGVNLDALPRFAWEIPENPWRGKLTSLIEVRALLPRGEILCRRWPLCPTAGLEEIGWTLRLERYAVQARNSPLVADRLIVTAGPGGRKAARRFAERLRDDWHLAPAEADLWQETLAATGLNPGAELRRKDYELAPELRSDVALKRILHTLCDTMQANEAGLKGRVDAEFLHDYRVAVRRSRTALGQLQGVFPQRVVRRFTQQLADLGRLTGPARDFEVYLLEFQHLTEQLPEFMRAGLEPLKESLERHADQAYRRLSRRLNSAGYRRTMSAFAQYLAAPVPKRPSAPNARVPVAELLGRRIRKIYSRVLKQGKAISADTPAEAIHEWRKTCKKFRYLLEFSQTLHPHGKGRESIQFLKELQDHLGALQDCEVQIQTLTGLTAGLARSHADSTATLLVVGALIGRLDERRRENRALLPKRFAEFSRKERQLHFRRVFAREE